MWTILGSSGFVGRSLVKTLRQNDEELLTPSRNEVEAGIRNRSLGKVIYCIGLTADFRRRPMDAIQAHVCTLFQILTQNNIESVTYLSSTRVYGGVDATSETQPLIVNSANLSDLYNLSKLTGESLCLQSGVPARIVRLSNVYGDQNNPNYDSPLFIPALLKECAERKSLVLRTSPSSSKDYIHLVDAVNLILSIASEGKSNIYNVASGHNVSNAEIADILRKCGVPVEFASEAATIDFAPISTNRLREEFFTPEHSLLEDLPELLATFREHYSH